MCIAKRTGMSDNHLLCLDGVEIRSGDRVLVNGRQQGVIVKVFQPGDVAAAEEPAPGGRNLKSKMSFGMRNSVL